MRDKWSLHFRSQWRPLIFRPQIYSLVTLVHCCVSTKLEVSITVLFWGNWRHGSEGRGTTLDVAPSEGHVIRWRWVIWIHWSNMLTLLWNSFTLKIFHWNISLLSNSFSLFPCKWLSRYMFVCVCLSVQHASGHQCQPTTSTHQHAEA